MIYRNNMSTLIARCSICTLFNLSRPSAAGVVSGRKPCAPVRHYPVGMLAWNLQFSTWYLLQKLASLNDRIQSTSSSPNPLLICLHSESWSLSRNHRSCRWRPPLVCSTDRRQRCVLGRQQQVSVGDGRHNGEAHANAGEWAWFRCSNLKSIE